ESIECIERTFRTRELPFSIHVEKLYWDHIRGGKLRRSHQGIGQHFGVKEGDEPRSVAEKGRLFPSLRTAGGNWSAKVFHNFSQYQRLVTTPFQSEGITTRQERADIAAGPCIESGCLWQGLAGVSFKPTYQSSSSTMIVVDELREAVIAFFLARRSAWRSARS